MNECSEDNRKVYPSFLKKGSIFSDPNRKEVSYD